ncbi:MAG: hypothetical protein ACREPM_04285 [Gemmatimonadaceae bacterium]
MIDAPTPSRDAVLAQVLQWLPGLYRARDEQNGNQLRSFLSVFADELWRLRLTIEQQHADHFIDSAQDWVIPYIAELVGTTVLFTGEATLVREIARRNRDDVKNTMHWRRQKGTLAGIQDVAAGVGGWGTHAAEMFEHVAWMQNLTHIRKGATFAVDLRDGEAVARASTPFSTLRALADVRSPDQRVGWYQTRNVCVFEWPIQSYAVRGVTPFDVGGGCYQFHPLGLDTAVFAGCDSEAERSLVTAVPGAQGADIANVNATDTPIRTRDLRAHPAAYVATAVGFTIREDGISLIGGQAPASASTTPALDYPELATASGMIAADQTTYAAGTQFEIAAVRLGAAMQLINAVPTPVAYSPGQPFAAQLQVRGVHGRIELDTVAPSFAYTLGASIYQPTSGEYHHPALLLSVTNTGAAATAMPASEIILRNARGAALQVVMPAIAALAPASPLFLYVADDGSTYFARDDHQTGTPDRNPDSAVFGAFAARHLARASEGQRRVRPGHPAAPARFRTVVARPLCCWDKPLVPAVGPGEIAVDPERGRLAFPPAEIPTGDLTVDFRFGRTTTIGAGPFARTNLPSPSATVGRTRDADFSTIQAAIDAAPNASDLPVVIEILDSAVYEESLSISNRNFPGGFTLQASALETPVLRKPAASPRLFRLQTSTVPTLVFDGLSLTGGAVQIGDAVDHVHLRTCTLDPRNVTLAVASAGAVQVQLESCISGPVAVTAPAGALDATDTIIQHPDATIEVPSGVSALSLANGSALLERVTILGDLSAHDARISNTLCYGDVALIDLGASCLRFSRLPRSLAGARSFQCTQATPIWISIDVGDAGYFHLYPTTATQLTRGGEEGGEIGAFASAGLPWRTQNTGLRLDEYVPAALTPMQVRVLPRLRFRGIARL